MKTIISITLGGRSIAIEDTAFEKIKDYTESLRQYYRHEEGRDEIIADIEGRFSELMHEKIRKGAAHITDADIDEMITTMGRPEDFDKAESTPGSGAGYSGPNFSFGEKRRLYRDESNKMIGGVCSGIANWLNIDPTVVRVLFAIISFGGFGSGLLIYVLLWIFLPAKNMNIYRGKRMFRNPDDKMIGGVAGGMGAYFNISPNTIRWVLAIPLILSVLKSIHFFGWNPDFHIFSNLFFGGLTGTFIFMYIVLWIVLPEANTPYQKMEMYGKTIDVNTIKENVQGSMGDIKDRMQNWSKEVKEAGERIGHQAHTFAHTRGKQFGREFGQVAVKSGKGAGYIIAMIFKAVFLFLAAIIVVPLFIVFLAFLFSGFAWAPVNNFLWTSDTQQMWAWGTLLFFIGAPIVGMLIGLIRMILNVRTPGNYLNWLFGGLWTIGWVCLVMFMVSISKDFKRTEITQTPVAFVQPVNGKLILKVSQPELEHKNDFSWLNGGNSLDGFSLTPDTLKISTIGVEFVKSDDSLFHVNIKKQSFGRTDADAMSRVQKIHYTPIVTDSILDLENGFAIDKASKYRFQNVVVEVQVPVGGKIKIDPSVKEKLNGATFPISNYKDLRRIRWMRSSLTNYRADVDYTMDSTGRLVSNDEKSISNKAEDNDDNYQWDDADSNAIAPVAPLPPAAPATGDNDTSNVYRYDARPVSTDTSRQQIRKELLQKQKEIEELKKKLEQ